eukprot:XP_011666711.1 PREDICTED: C2 domain-containing protein 3 [Strongylocentrotus purpuratus]
MATELMRVVSKKVTGKEVSFGHRSVFPVQFDGQAVDRWWKQLLVFKVFSKVAGDKHPTILGVASIPLRSLIQSPDLVTISELPVKDKTSPSRTADQDSSQRGNMIGLISVSMELASDSKDFASALAKTRVAEMQGAKIVPLPSSDPRAGLGHLTRQASSPSSSKHASPGRHQNRDGDQSRTVGKSSGALSSGHPEADVGHSETETTQTTKTNRETTPKHQDGYEALTLHSLLYVRDGHLTTSSIPGQTMPSPHPYPSLQYSSGGRDRVVNNTYLVGRMFWLDDAARSDVCWGTTQPAFDFVQVSPVLLTQSLLERMRNNFTVIEVWDKKTSAQHDQLLGIAKLPLHQLYMSYRDQRIGKTLLKSQYPVVAVDNEVPITDPFTGQRCGQLTILLALGSQQQVSALQRLKSIRRDATDVPERPIRYGERTHVHSADQEVEDSGAVEHVFEVVIEGIQGLPQLEDSVWGEADCFIQYHFPHQQQQLQQQQEFGGLIQDSSLTLRPHRTPTTLCVPDPVFNDVCRHRVILVQGTPVQRELLTDIMWYLSSYINFFLTACAGVGGHAGGIPFEVWCRFYYPNVRDQVIAKATLPLAKLCAMVTMQRRGEPSVQTFSLPLRTHQDDQERAAEESSPKLRDSGLLDVTVSYRQTVIQHKTHPSRERGAGGGGPHVSLALAIHRACGLKSAATSLARHDNGMQYTSQVGVNSYIKIQLSFMAKDEMRVTRTIARSFCPEYNHHVELPCPLLLAPGEGEEEEDVMSLAEALESADLILQVWHQVPGFRTGESERPHQVEDTLPRGGGGGMMGHRVIAETGDILIGSATIPLVKLLANRTGLEGWFPISLPLLGWDTAPLPRQHDPLSDTPDDTPQPHPKLLDRVAGGVELAVKFRHQGDRERVIDAGRKVGWSPDSLVLEDVEQIWDDGVQDQGSSSSLSCEVTIDVDGAWFPVQPSLRPGQTQLDPHTKAYIRYKFYDKGAVCSKLCYLDQTGDGQLCADLKHCHVLHANQSQPFAWYLREEQLEVQLWLSYNSELPEESKARPRHRDKLIGCTYIDLSPLCHQRVKRHRVSGVFPLFKPGCADMGGACLRAHVTMRVTSEQKPVTFQQDQHKRVQDEESVDEETRPSDDTKEGEGVKERVKEEEEERQKNQPVWMTVVVERAMRLSDFTDPSRVESVAPSSYVTFQSAVGPSPAVTPTVPSSNNPQWKYIRDVAISPQLLDNQSLIFKIWHQISSKQDSTCDRVLGFIAVDLGPLLAGIRSLDGWYNIMDFSGQTLGQIKISITPKESLSPLRHSPKQRAMLGSPNSSNLFSRAPLPPPHYLLSSLPSSSNRPGNSLPSTHPAVRSLNHFEQHLEGVRQFHGKLQDRLRSLHRMETDSGSSEDGIQHTVTQNHPEVGIQQSDFRSHLSERTPSSSYLLETFRKNMEELDELHQRLKTKLSGGETPSSSALPNAASHHHGNSGSDAERRRMSADDVNGDGGGQVGHSGQYGAGNMVVDDGTVPHGSENNNQQHHHHHHHNLQQHNYQDHLESSHSTFLIDKEERTDGREDDERTSNWSTEGDPSDEALRDYTHRDGGSRGGDEEDTRNGRVTMDPKYENSGMRREDVGGEDGDDDGRHQFLEDGARGDDEDSMIYVRPLNDISCPAFSNGINDDVISPPSSRPPHYIPSSSSHRYTSEHHDKDELHHHGDDEIKPSDGIDDDLLAGNDRLGGRIGVEEYQDSNTIHTKDDGYYANQISDAFSGGRGGDGEQDGLHSYPGTDPVHKAGFDGMGRDMVQGGHAQQEDAVQGHHKNASSTLPDFFLPPTDLEASMRALYNTVSGPPSHELSARDQAKFEAAHEMAQRLGSGGQQRSQAASRTTLPFSYKQPTADQAKRIAKIFSAKF